MLYRSHHLKRYSLWGEEAPSEMEDSFRQSCAEQDLETQHAWLPTLRSTLLIALLFENNSVPSHNKAHSLLRQGIYSREWTTTIRDGKKANSETGVLSGNWSITLPDGLARSVTLAKRPEPAV